MKLLALVISASLAADAAGVREVQSAAANPIRKVVTLLQMMQKKVMAEAEKETELYDKYMCYCKTGASTLSKIIADNDAKIPQLQSAIEEAEAKMKQLKEDVAAHQADRAAAKEAIAKATAIREKEAAAFAKETAELTAFLNALDKAIAALEKGVSGGFLQTSASAVLRRLVLANRDMDEDNRQKLLAFLSGTAGNEYAPQSGEIIGILKQMKDEMAKDKAETIAAEEAAIAAYKELMAAKTKEIAALTKMIEDKLTRIAELGVEIATMKNDL
jgi:outer membrane murein-binding lipoprotein Lpp